MINNIAITGDMPAGKEFILVEDFGREHRLLIVVDNPADGHVCKLCHFLNRNCFGVPCRANQRNDNTSVHFESVTKDPTISFKTR